LKENKTRFVSNLLIPYKYKWQKRLIKFLYFLFGPLGKILGFKIYNQDKRQLQRQSKNIEKNGKKKYIYNYVVDKPIELYNKWMREYGHEITSI
jgi:hypothetical protein